MLIPHLSLQISTSVNFVFWYISTLYFKMAAGTRRSRSPEEDKPSKRFHKNDRQPTSASASASSFSQPYGATRTTRSQSPGKKSAPQNPLLPGNGRAPTPGSRSQRAKSSTLLGKTNRTDETLPAKTLFGGPYKPRLGDFMDGVKLHPRYPGTNPEIALSHLNCSYFSHPSRAPAPL
jgi:hypothetical protein